MKRLLEIKDRYVKLSKGFIDYEKLNNYLITHHSTAIASLCLMNAVNTLKKKSNEWNNNRN